MSTTMLPQFPVFRSGRMRSSHPERALHRLMAVLVLLLVNLASPSVAQITTPYALTGNCTTSNEITVSVGALTVTDICTSPTDT